MFAFPSNIRCAFCLFGLKVHPSAQKYHLVWPDLIYKWFVQKDYLSPSCFKLHFVVVTLEQRDLNDQHHVIRAHTSRQTETVKWFLTALLLFRIGDEADCNSKPPEYIIYLYLCGHSMSGSYDAMPHHFEATYGLSESL